MVRRRMIIFAALALVVAACGGVDEAEEASSTTAATTAPTAAQLTTTTTAAPTTTTTAATTTTSLSVTSSDSAALVKLRAAIAQSSEVVSGRMEGLMEMTGVDETAGRIEISIPFGGAFDNRTGDFSFFMDMSGLAAAGGEEVPPEMAGLFGEMEVRQVGDTAYIKFPLFAMFFGAETDWIAAPADEGTDAAGGFTGMSPGNPSEMLREFEEANAQVEEVGSELLNGIPTTHYRVIFDTETLLAEATPEEREELLAQGPIPVDELPMDIWISDDGLVHRFVMDIDGSDVVGGDEEFERMLIRYDLLDYGAEVAIEPPPDDEVTHVDDLENMFGFGPTG